MAFLKGLVPVLVTPMTEDGEPDIAGISNLVDFLCRKHVGGIWALGSAGEDTNMTFTQKVTTAKAIVQGVNRRIPVLMGTGMWTIDDNLRFFEKMVDHPVDGYHLLASDVKAGDTRMEHYFTFLAERSPAPLWIHHNPKRARTIAGELLKTLSQHPNIGGIKTGGYSLAEMTAAMMLRNSEFDVIGAGGGQLFTMLCLGAEAHTTSEASCLPELFFPVFEAFKSGDLARAREIQFDVIRFSKSLPRTDNGEYAAEEKFILTKRGICNEHVNRLYRTLTLDEKSGIMQSLAGIEFNLETGYWKHWSGGE